MTYCNHGQKGWQILSFLGEKVTPFPLSNAMLIRAMFSEALQDPQHRWWRRGRMLIWDFGLDLWSRTNCSRIIFEMHTAPGACSKYALGAVCIQIMLSWSIFDLDYSSRLLMVEEQLFLDHMTISRGQNLKKIRQDYDKKHKTTPLLWTMSCPIFSLSG